MSEDGATSGYVLGTEERRRLELLEQCLDPVTARSLDAIGIQPGWRCLELGAGAGSVTRMLSDRVGPDGRVVAVDLDTRFIEELGVDNVEVHRGDVVADGLPGDAYDFVHARMLLMHLPTREKFIEGMAAVLRPGGWLLVEDMDAFPFQSVAEGTFEHVWTAALRAFQSVGVATNFGRKLPSLFDGAGLEAVEAVCEVPVFRGDTHFTEMFITTAAQLRPLLAANGITDDHLSEFAREFADPTQWFHAFAMYSVRGRAPGAG